MARRARPWSSTWARRCRACLDAKAGKLSLADLYLAPILAYVALTPDKDAVFGVDGMQEWRTAAQALPSYQVTAPNSG